MDLNFRCIMCGKCCRNLLSEDEKTGFTLFPGEEQKFPSNKVKPCLGIGEVPEEEDFEVFSYQYIENECIHLYGNKCRIYEKRPIVCRGYPFRLVVKGKENLSYEVAPECTSVKNIKTVKISRKNQELKYARMVGYRLISFYEKTRKNERWRFNLVKSNWEPFT